ncbi:hypothetical protein XENORESO_000080 [Xenotaenia resolanae]|uniref:Uncharacterized protein n=1 Tax=Xenotaenia resolanae TaxID=208358 RepID=A0ABV0X1F6_9TELE
MHPNSGSFCQILDLGNRMSGSKITQKETKTAELRFTCFRFSVRRSHFASASTHFSRCVVEGKEVSSPCSFIILSFDSSHLSIKSLKYHPQVDQTEYNAPFH